MRITNKDSGLITEPGFTIYRQPRNLANTC
jgi:hypothetical protein